MEQRLFRPFDFKPRHQIDTYWARLSTRNRRVFVGIVGGMIGLLLSTVVFPAAQRAANAFERWIRLEWEFSSVQSVVDFEWSHQLVIESHQLAEHPEKLSNAYPLIWCIHARYLNSQDIGFISASRDEIGRYFQLYFPADSLRDGYIAYGSRIQPTTDELFDLIGCPN